MPKLFVIGGIESRGAADGEINGIGLLEFVPTKCQTNKAAQIPSVDIAIIDGLLDMMVFFRILPVL